MYERIKVPTAFTKNGFRFYFWSNEENRAHIHVDKGDGNAKYWLRPAISQKFSYGYTTREISKIEELIIENYNELITKWDEHIEKKNS